MRTHHYYDHKLGRIVYRRTTFHTPAPTMVKITPSMLAAGASALENAPSGLSSEELAGRVFDAMQQQLLSDHSAGSGGQ